jgi:hypothetical protein
MANSDEEFEALRRGFGTNGYRGPSEQPTYDPNAGTQAVRDRRLSGGSTQADFAISVEVTRETLINAGPAAAAKIAHLAVSSTNERVALDASKYIMERVLGPAGAKMETPKGPLQDMLESMFEEAEQVANAGGAR